MVTLKLRWVWNTGWKALRGKKTEQLWEILSQYHLFLHRSHTESSTGLDGVSLLTAFRLVTFEDWLPLKFCTEVNFLNYRQTIRVHSTERLLMTCRKLIHLVVCLMTGPKPLPNRALHIVRSRASSFKCEYPLLSLRSSSSFLRFLPRLPVTSLHPFNFPSITRCRRK